MEVLEIALANWPVPELTKEGTPSDMQPELCKQYGPPPPVNAEYFRERCSSPDWFDSDEDLACYTGYDDSSWTSRPNTWTSRPFREAPWWGPNTREPNTSSYNNNDDAAPNYWVHQSWQSNAPRTQVSTRTNQSDSYYYDDEPWLGFDDEEEYLYEPSVFDATQSWSTPLCSYDSVPVPEPMWQPYNMPQYNHEIETVEKLRHLGTFGFKPPY